MRRKILIVDDHRRNIDILERLFAADYEIRSTLSGVEALEVAPDYKPHIVLLDIMMPEMDGYETCRRMREMEGLKDTKIIMVSAKAMVSERLEGYRAGADDYVTKPFDLDELAAKVDVYARLRHEEMVTRDIADLTERLMYRAGPPISYVRDAMDLLRDEGDLSEEHHKLVRISKGCVSAVWSVGMEVRTLISIEVGGFEISPGPVDMRSVVDASVEEAEWQLRRRGANITTEHEGSALVEADETHIRQAMHAVTDYVIRHTPRGADIGLTTSGDGDVTVSFAVRNRGSDNTETRHATTDERDIALRVATHVVELHGGRIDIHVNGNIVVGCDMTVPAKVATGDQAPAPVPPEHQPA